MSTSGKVPQTNSAETIFENVILPARAWSTITRALFWQIGTLLAFSLSRSLLLLEPFYATGDGFPIGWIKHSINSIAHPSSWLYDALVVGCFSFLGMLHLRNFKTSSKVTLVGGGGIKGLITPIVTALISDGLIEAFSSLLAHVCISAFLLRCYIGILGPSSISSLTKLCNQESDDTCINEAHVFLIVSGAYTGFRAWWKLHGPSNGNVLKFPLIQQSGNSLLRQRISGELLKEAFDVGLSLRWFCFGYYILGQRIEIFFADSLRIEHHYNDDSSALYQKLSYNETLWYYFNLLLHTWTINALLNLNLGILHAIFSINMTKRVRFPVTTIKSNASTILLMDAMKNDGTKSAVKESGLLLKHIAFQDFADLTSAQSKVRRSDFFLLSQPGGHPHNWNEVKMICLNTISEFSKDLELASKPSNVDSTKTEIPMKNSRITSNVNGTPTMPRFRRLGGPQTPLDSRSTLSGTSGIQDLVQSKYTASLLGDVGSNVIANEDNVTMFGRVEKYLAKPEKIANALSSASSMISASSGGSSGDNAIRSVYAKSQIVIWAVEGMSHLVSASIEEDRYGVVQKDLPNVLEALLLLQQTVEKHRKGATATARKNRFETRDLQLKQELRVALKSSLFRICVVFGEHLDALPIAQDLRNRLNNYQTFAEA